MRCALYTTAAACNRASCQDGMTCRCLLLHPLIVKAGLPRKRLQVRRQVCVDLLRIMDHCSCTTEPISRGVGIAAACFHTLLYV